ncbi:MAG: MarR family winged helix-turn-helix transcriptional regulator [Clostridia bacterium]
MDNNILLEIKVLDKLLGRFFFKPGTMDEMASITQSQMQILDYIVECGKNEIYQKDLEEAVDLRRATVSGILQTMEKNQLITRVIDDTDTRTKKIILTKESEKRIAKNKEKVVMLQKITTEGISDEDLETFRIVLRKMTQNVQEFYKKGMNI